MPTHILVPIDGSDHAYGGLYFALEAFPEAALTTFHVILPADESAEGADRSDDYHERAAAIAEDMGRTLDAETVVGVPHRRILKRTVEGGFDLVIMGSHGRSPVTGAFVGHVTEGVVRRVPVTAAIVPLPLDEIQTRDIPGRILLPTDGSDPANSALTYVLRHFSDAPLTALYVLDVGVDPGGRLEDIAGTYVGDLLDLHGELADDVLAAARELAQAHDREIETDTAIGRPRHAILDYAGAGEFDTIVMGRHGRQGVRRGLLGSVAESVAHRSPVPVILR